jgi:hypothetical protein
MNSITKTFFLVLTACTHLTSATIVILRGTGSAGKTSLCKELIAIDPSWKLLDEDEMYIEQSIGYFRTYFPQEVASIEQAIADANLFHALQRHQIVFRSTATVQEKSEALNSLYTIRVKLHQCAGNNDITSKAWNRNLSAYVLDCINMHLANGFNVVLDSWGLLRSEHVALLQEQYEVITILAYCPLRDVINRTIQRNAHALLTKNLASLRYYRHMLRSFINLYDFEENNSVRALDSITREDINNELDIVSLLLCTQDYPDELSNGFSQVEFSRNQLYDYRVNCMKKFANNNPLYIVPKIPVDFCIRTDNSSPFENCQRLLQVIGT